MDKLSESRITSRVKNTLSVITVALNCRDELEKTVTSLRPQKVKGVEYVVIDGNSADHTLQYITEISDFIDVFVSEPDKGVYDAMNKGVVRSTGEYKWFLNAGDTLCEGAVESVLEAIHRNTGTKLICGSTVYRRDSLETVQPEFKPCMLATLKRFNVIPHPSTIVSENVFEQYGLFDSTLKVAGDYEFFLRIMHHTPINHITGLGRTLVNMESGGLSDPLSSVFRVFGVSYELYKIHDQYYGSFYAAKRYIMNLCFFQWIRLKSVLSDLNKNR